VSKLHSPRAGARTLADHGERSAFVGGQRVGRARRRPPRWRATLSRIGLGLLVAVLATGLTGVAARALVSSPAFAVTSVEVRGASRIAPDRILAAAGLHSGDNLFRVDPDEVVARIEAMPEIRRAELIRELPGRVIIVVEERRPFTLVHAGRLHWIDEEGRLLGEERRAVAPAVPLISGLSDEEIENLRTSPGPRARVALGLVRSLLRSGSRLVGEISEIDVSRSEGPVLYTMDGIEVRLGSEDWADRLARLEGVLAEVAGRDSRVSSVDLRFRDQVVLRHGGS